jgi:hypothetical protein
VLGSQRPLPAADRWGCSRQDVDVIRAADRAIVASIDLGDRAHAAMASPDDRWILNRK